MPLQRAKDAPLRHGEITHELRAKRTEAQQTPHDFRRLLRALHLVGFVDYGAGPNDCHVLVASTCSTPATL